METETPEQIFAEEVLEDSGPEEADDGQKPAIEPETNVPSNLPPEDVKNEDNSSPTAKTSLIDLKGAETTSEEIDLPATLLDQENPAPEVHNLENKETVSEETSNPEESQASGEKDVSLIMEQSDNVTAAVAEGDSSETEQLPDMEATETENSNQDQVNPTDANTQVKPTQGDESEEKAEDDSKPDETMEDNPATSSADIVDAPVEMSAEIVNKDEGSSEMKESVEETMQKVNEDLEEMEIVESNAVDSQDLQTMKTIDVSINGNVVTAEVVHQDTDNMMDEVAVTEAAAAADIVTELPSEKGVDDEMESSDDNINSQGENDIVTLTTPGGRVQVFAEIIEEEIIEEIDESVMMMNNRADRVHHPDDFITSLDKQPPSSRRIQAREDVAKRKQDSVLLSTKKIIDSSDDALRSSQALLKSTEAGDKGAEQPPPREKRQKKKKTKADVQKEKEVDPDYDPEDDFDDKEFLTPKDLDSAAFASRLPADRMTKQEAITFSDIFNVKESHSHFLYIRNRLLFIWLEDPKNKLTVEDAVPRIEPPHNEDEVLVKRVYQYLNRYGFINFGVFNSPTKTEISPTAPKILVVGAGVSGVTAARQLQQFGLNVEIIEARSVVGGRVCTFKDGPHTADLGAMVVTGLGGNPLAVLAKQLNLDLMPIKQDCPLYEFTGQMVPKERDERVEREFNRLLEATTYMSHQLNVNSINGRPVSLGQALEIIIKLQIRQVKEKQLKHGRDRCDIQEKLNHIQQALFPLHEKIKDSHSKYLELKMKHEELSDQLGEVIRDQKAEFEVKAAYKVMLETFAEYDALLKEQQELEVKLTKMEQMVPNEIYMTPQERHVLDWHCANLEFANAAPLSALSLKHWDQDDDFEFTGNHLIVHDGMSAIPDAMSEGLKIRHNTACVGIKYSDNGVEVATREVNQVNSSWASSTTTTISADAVLLTIPLGVLKKEKLKFEPSLPEWKTSAIKRMGFGNLNKVVLCFNKVFWDKTIHLFGHVSNSTISRGELFLFWSVSKAPVLIALIAGEAATVIETVPDEAIVGRAMTILRAIFGFQTVPQPNKFRVTRWRGDPWALGSYSYVAAGSSGNDYDDLARPVAPHSASGALPRVFFAGEHTIRNYPATVHGALLSGLREAGRITDQFLGPPHSKEQLAGAQ